MMALHARSRSITRGRLPAGAGQRAGAIPTATSSSAIPEIVSVSSPLSCCSSKNGGRTTDLEFLLRRTPLWREIAKGILLGEGDIVERGEEAEEEAVEGAAARGAPVSGGTSLGIGGLRTRSAT